MLKRFVDLLRWVILGCLGSVEQIRAFIPMRYFGFFGFYSTNSWIYSDGSFCVIWVLLNKFVDLFRCIILGCFGCVEEICGSILMRYFGFFGLC